MLGQFYGIDRTCDTVPPMLDHRMNVHHEGLKNVECVGAPDLNSATLNKKTSFGMVASQQRGK